MPAKRLCSSLGSFTAFMGTVAGICDEPAPAESDEEEATAAKSELQIYFELPDAGMEEDILAWSGGQGTKRFCQICPEWQGNT